MYSQLTDRVRIVLQYAEEEARRMHHAHVGPEHILLGLLKEGTGVGANVLKNLGADLEDARLQVERLVPIQPEAIARDEARYTAETKQVLEHATEESRNLNHNWVGTEHILLGLLREERGPAAQALANLGLTSEKVRSELLLVLGVGHDPGAPAAMGHEPSLEVRKMFQHLDGPNAAKARGFLGPNAVDQMVRQAITMCWMMLPDDQRSISTVESEIRRLVDRALANLKEDAQAFGIPEKE